VGGGNAHVSTRVVSRSQTTPSLPSNHPLPAQTQQPFNGADGAGKAVRDLLEYCRCFVEWWTGITDAELAALASHFRMFQLQAGVPVMERGARASFWGVVCTGTVTSFGIGVWAHPS
jgi:hypothetical protein